MAAKLAAGEAEELPKTVVRRVVKDKLSQLSSSSSSKSKKPSEEGDITVNKDALLAFSESARIFIHYLSATANDICKESKRQTINAEDVLKALEEIEFPEFVGPLRTSLDEFRHKNAGKRSEAAKAKEVKKRKQTKELAVENGEASKAKEAKRKKVEEPVVGESDGIDSEEDEDETNGSN